MSNIVLKNVCKSYDKEHYAVQDFSLEIPDREFVILLDLPAAENRRRFG